MRKESKEKSGYVKLIHFAVYLKLTQYCKSIILKKKKKKHISHARKKE